MWTRVSRRMYRRGNAPFAPVSAVSSSQPGDTTVRTANGKVARKHEKKTTRDASSSSRSTLALERQDFPQGTSRESRAEIRNSKKPSFIPPHETTARQALCLTPQETVVRGADPTGAVAKPSTHHMHPPEATTTTVTTVTIRRVCACACVTRAAILFELHKYQSHQTQKDCSIHALDLVL